jgi:pectate lyase
MNRVQLFRSVLRKCSGGLALAAVALAVHATQAQVTLPWYEPFAYNLGQLGNATNNNSSYTTPPGVWHGDNTLGDSTGWGSIGIYGICNLSYSGLQTSSNSAGVIFPSGCAKNRHVGVLLPSVATTTAPLYTSFLINPQVLPTGARMFACFSSASTGTSPGSSCNGIFLNANGTLGVSVSGIAPGASGSTAITTNTTHLVVGCYSNKVFKIWLDPATSSFGAAESSVPSASFSYSSSSGKSPMNSFFLTQGADVAAGGTFPDMVLTMDEIRVGSTWASVTPSAAVVAPVATALSFTGQPGYAGVGASIGTVVVQVVDQFGNPIATSGKSVTLSLSGSGSLGGTRTQTTDGTGKATFSGLTVSATGIDQLVANASSLTSSTSDYFSILAGSGGGGSTPVVTQAFNSPAGFVLRGNNGQASQSFKVLASSSLSAPRSSWTQIGTASFAGDGSFNCTNATSGNVRFYAIAYTSSGGGGAIPSFAAVGFANAGNVTGGKGGPTVIVSNYNDLQAYCTYPLPLIIKIQGAISNAVNITAANAYCDIPSNAPNKSIIGIGTNALIYGTDLRPSATNIIIQNLYMACTPGGTNDCITMDGGANGTNAYTWLDHCDFYNGQDGNVDMTKGVDNITLSWCHFHYSVDGNPALDHRLCNLIGSSDTTSAIDTGKLHITFHHCWYDTNCMERMPSVRWGRVHIFNNYYACPGNDYCVRTRISAQVLVESTYFSGVNDPFEQYINASESVHGLMLQTNNITLNCTSNYNYILITDPSHQNPGSLISSNSTSITFSQGGTYTIVNGYPANDVLSDLNPPPYSYTPDPVANVPALVQTYCGPGKILPPPSPSGN